VAEQKAALKEAANTKGGGKSKKALKKALKSMDKQRDGEYGVTRGVDFKGVDVVHKKFSKVNGLGHLGFSIKSLHTNFSEFLPRWSTLISHERYVPTRTGWGARRERGRVAQRCRWSGPMKWRA
jgi:hypothetical protein